MRESYKGGFLKDGDVVYAVNLGSDYCAEHEWGIDKLKRYLGINSDAAFGLPRRITTTVNPEGLRWVKSKQTVTINRKRVQVTYQGFVFDKYSNPKENPKPFFYDKANLWHAWDSESFAVYAVNEDDIANLKRIFAALQEARAVIWVGGGGPFGGQGLVIAIADLLPAEGVAKWEVHDDEQHRLNQFEIESGIKDKLRAAGKNWFALSPRFKEDGTIKFWLNPTEQDQNNCGWFTVSDLEAWARNEGPIPKR